MDSLTGVHRFVRLDTLGTHHQIRNEHRTYRWCNTGPTLIEQDEVFRMKTQRRPGTLAAVLAAIAEHGANLGDIEMISVQRDYNIRDVTVIAPNEESVDAIQAAISGVHGVEIVTRIDKVFHKHEGGKIATRPTVDVRTLQDIREIYTPGVARVSSAIAADESLADRYTWRSRTVAVVSNGSRVLGLGNIGPAAALPVMEGKALFYPLFVGLNAVPIMLDTQDADEIIETVVRIAPGFGAIHLEDIASPDVYRIEAELDERLSMPVMHDDQHGTATVVLAAAVSAARMLGKPLDELVFGQVGLGAAGSAIAALASRFDFGRIIAFDPGEPSVPHFLGQIDQNRLSDVSAGTSDADLEKVLTEADVLVMATGRPGLLRPDQVKEGSVVFALSNPVPEITVSDAEAAGAALAADGSIVNNVLAYPALFLGALNAGADRITPTMRRAAAVALADLAPEGALLPDPLDHPVHVKVAEAVAAAAPR